LTPGVDVGPAKPPISTHFNPCQRSKGFFFGALAYHKYKVIVKICATWGCWIRPSLTMSKSRNFDSSAVSTSLLAPDMYTHRNPLSIQDLLNPEDSPNLKHFNQSLSNSSNSSALKHQKQRKLSVSYECTHSNLLHSQWRTVKDQTSNSTTPIDLHVQTQLLLLTMHNYYLTSPARICSKHHRLILSNFIFVPYRRLL